MTRWEYTERCHCHVIGDIHTLGVLNEFGDLGWELVAALPGENSILVSLFFKRPLPEGDGEGTG